MTNVYTPASPWGVLVILVPVIGGIGVVFLVENFAPEARGHGVPEVMDAIFYKEGRIQSGRCRREVIGLGALHRQRRRGRPRRADHPDRRLARFDLRPDHQHGCLAANHARAAGAGAGIAATFNTPIGGVMFAIELMLPEVSVRTFLPVALATGTATFIGTPVRRPQACVSTCPALCPPVSTHPTPLAALLLYAALGAATRRWRQPAFIRGLHTMEERVPTRPAIPICAMRSACCSWGH